jgi:hypothetical protein
LNATCPKCGHHFDPDEKTVRLVATRDIPCLDPIHRSFSAKSGDIITVPLKSWNAKRKLYRVIYGHGEWEDYDGFTEKKPEDQD